MRLLVLGGTHFVGRCVVEEAMRRGDVVTVVNRGVSGEAPAAARTLRADRREPGALAAALGSEEWDAVVDTWSMEPAVVRDSARLLAGRVGHYGYVSSRSVYQWPIPSGADERAPLVDGDPASPEASEYAAAKRGGELAVLESFGDAALLARAGLVLGPYEDVGRLPWWLDRMRRGGQVLAPGPPERGLQYVDARDLARWMLDSAERGLAGAFNTVSLPGHTTTDELLSTCNEVTGGGATLVWVSPEAIEEAGLAAWTELPIWTPPTGELAGLHDCDVSAALSEGLVCRPVHETVLDTWRWQEEAGLPAPRPDRPPVGLDPEVEQAVLAAR
jgi:2'-hydroxyisoflavone reductase